jgi:cardiolipin synthase
MMRRPRDAATDDLLRLLAAQALSRAGGAPLVAGNDARILKDADEHFPAFLAAIRAARRTIYLENYIFADDPVGRQLADALVERASAGVSVRVLCDWLGSFRLPGRFWRPLAAAGGEMRWFNRPSIASPLGGLARDHRKMLSVDGRIGFVTGLCISSRWFGDPAKGVPPWRDTGVAVRGPAVADIERAFAQTWAASGAPLPAAELTPPETIAAAGDVTLRVLPAVPSAAGLYRLDLLVAVMARQTL